MISPVFSGGPARGLRSGGRAGPGGLACPGGRAGPGGRPTNAKQEQGKQV